MSNARKMGLLSALALVINFQLGSGFFLSPSQIAPMGRWGLWGWLVSGMGALALCHIFSVLSLWNDEEGGPHVYVESAFGKRVAFYVAWSYWVVGWISSLPLIWLAVTSLQDILGAGGQGQALLFSMLLIVFATVMNVQGIVFSGASEVFFSMIKIFPMVVIPLVCWPFVQKNPLALSSDFSPIDSLGRATLSTFWGFLGIEAGTTVIQSVKNPRRSIPIALFGGTVAVLSIYFLGSGVVMSILPQDVLARSTNAYTALLSHVFGHGWAKGVSFAVFVVCATTVNSWLLVSGQVGLMAAKRGLFPGFFQKTNARGAPTRGVLVTAMALGSMVILGSGSTIQEQLGRFVDFSVGLFIVTYLVSVLSLVQLIRKGKIASSWLLRLSIGASTFFCIWVLASMQVASFIVMMLISVVGGLLARFLKWPVY